MISALRTWFDPSDHHRVGERRVNALAAPRPAGPGRTPAVLAACVAGSIGIGALLLVLHRG